jgi:uncharacterized protein YidB (DUF937 family)
MAGHPDRKLIRKEFVMGLLDSVIGALGQGGGGAANPQAALINAIVGMLAQGGGGGGGAGGLGGGLAGLVEQFSRSGLGHVANSWVGTGQNLPISPDQLGQVLGRDQLSGMASQLGMNQGDLLGQLAHMLPQVVDKLTPQGQIPQGDVGGMGDLGSLLGGLLGGARR